MPGKCELPLEPPIEYERYKKRFLVRSITIDDYAEHTYTKPEIEIQEAAEWDEFMKDFTKSFSLPYCVFLHDIGDWEDPANRLIKLKGAVAHSLWQNIKKYNVLNEDSISYLAGKIKEEFLNTPKTDKITDDIKIFLQTLRKIKLIN